METLRGKKIFVGLSGGVDSAVSAYLLKKAGAQVVGVFIKGWYPEGLPCTWASDRRDAMRVAAHLHIPFTTLDASAEYKGSVLDYLIREYQAGNTPNPDIMCNREVKFGVFFSYALSKGADAIATGHYARTQDGRLFRGKDEVKDQSYFLWGISKEALLKTYFPIGELKKERVRAIAKQAQLPVASKKDSQGICFLGPVSVEDFLRKELTLTKGKAFDEEGYEVGEHDSVLLYTLGERVSLRNAPPGPWYVSGKRIRENELVVSKKKTPEKETRILLVRDANWFTVIAKTNVEAQFRYHGPVIQGDLQQEEGMFTPLNPLPETPATGQSLVFYDTDECIGGGIIS